MLSKKYTKDYRVSYELSPRGRLQPSAVYAGKYYRFSASPEELAAFKKRLLLYGVPALVILILLLTFTNLFHRDYRWLSLPSAFALIAMVFVTMGVWRVLTAGDRFIRRRRDQLVNLFPPALLFFLVFSVLSVAGCVGELVIDGINLPMAVYTLGAVLLSVLSVLLFRLRIWLKTEELPADPEEDPPEPEEKEAE